MRKSAIVLKALEAGLPVKLFDQELRLAADHQLCFEATNIAKDGTKYRIWLGYPCQFSRFLEECEKLEDGYVAELAMNLGLNEAAKRVEMTP